MRSGLSSRIRLSPSGQPHAQYTLPVQWPLAPIPVMLSGLIIAYYGHIRDSEAPSRFMYYAAQLGSRPSSRGSPIYSASLSHRAIPSTPTDPTVVPDWYSLSVLPSPSPQWLGVRFTHACRVHVGRVMRLSQVRFRYGPMVCWPCLDQDVYFRAFTRWVAPTNVEYNYAASSLLPRPDFHRQDSQHYGLRAELAEGAKDRRGREESWRLPSRSTKSRPFD